IFSSPFRKSYTTQLPDSCGIHSLFKSTQHFSHRPLKRQPQNQNPLRNMLETELIAMGQHIDVRREHRPKKRLHSCDLPIFKFVGKKQYTENQFQGTGKQRQKLLEWNKPRYDFCESL